MLKRILCLPTINKSEYEKNACFAQTKITNYSYSISGRYIRKIPGAFVTRNYSIASTQSCEVKVLQALASTQSFQAQVLQGLASTRSFQAEVLPRDSRVLSGFRSKHSTDSRVLGHFSSKYSRH